VAKSNFFQLVFVFQQSVGIFVSSFKRLCTVYIHIHI